MTGLARLAALSALSALVGCGPAAAPAPVVPCPPALAAAPAGAPALPAPDDRLRRWQAIHAAGDAPPPGTSAEALLPELVVYLGSPDPARRDGIGYEVLAQWLVRAPRLGPAAVRQLAIDLRARLTAPIDPADGDGVFARSFAALALSLVVARDLAEPTVLDDAARRAILADAVAYARREPDLRGHTGVRGWAHAAAHTADLLKFLARVPSFTDADRASILDGVAALVVRRHGAIFHHGEDGRLAQPVLEAVRRGISPAAIDAWLQVIAAPLGEPALAEFEPGQYAAQRNARNLLFTLFVQLALDPAPAGQAAYLRDKLRVLLGG
ncbi:MAG: DUF2785 domain-containing protein [Kofleriaceae bacterium]|nr:DUF2785 domain-containing protein [Kofleriaceae bacterium]